MNESVDIEYNSKNGVLKNDLGHNAKFIKREVEWLQRIIQERLKEPNAEIELIQPAEDFFAGNYAQFIKKFDLDVYDIKWK